MRTRSTRAFAAACVAAFLATAGFLVLLLVRPAKDALLVDVDDAGTLLAALLACAGCAAAAARNRRHLRAGWALLAAGCLSLAAGEALWGFFQVFQGNADPFPSPADAAYLGAVPFLTAGILLLRPPSDGIRGRVRAVIDGIVVAGGVLSISWVTVIGSVWAAGGDSALSLSISVAYPASDVLVLSMLASLAMRIPRGGRAPVLLLIAGMATQAFADSAFAYLSVNSTYGGSNVIDAAYWAGYLLIALAGLRAALHPMSATRTAPPPGWTALALPYVPATAALALAVWLRFNGGLDPFLFSTLTVLSVAVLLRQFLAGADNVRLLRSLAAREAELRFQADHDPLTGLANRARLYREVEARLVSADPTPCALLFIDADGLKPINDDLGHGVGDLALQVIATRLAESVRAGDVAARIGGDEFAILLPHLDGADRAREVARRIVAAMGTPMHFRKDRAVKLSVSIGVATTRGGADVGAEDLLSMADVAMYAAKSSAKGSVVEWSERLEIARRRCELVEDAVERPRSGLLP